MGTWYQNVLFRDVDRASAEAAGRHVLGRLHSDEILGRELSREFVLGGMGYIPGERCQMAIATRPAQPPFGWVDGAELIVEPRFYHTQWPFDECRCRCPACDGAQSDAFFKDRYIEVMQSSWPDGSLRCELCGGQANLSEWTTFVVNRNNVTPFAVANLGLTFWSWPSLERSYFQAIGTKVNSRVLFLEGKL